MSLKQANKKPLEVSKVNRVGLAAVLVLALAACCCYCNSQASAEPTSSAVQSGGGGDSSGEQLAPKRQYFIAPRIGRSAGQAARSASSGIWSSLEGADLMAPGQIQPSRGYPGPLRNSLLFLLGNRRSIGPRSAAGLLPQARIGRRASPSGLLPQPRVGRRSSPSPAFESDVGGSELSGEPASELLDGANGGQQEVAVAALSDNAALNDAFESLING